MNEVIEAINNRIKTPYYGYFLLAFVALNWRAFFYLIFTTGDPQTRLASFDAHSDILSLLIYPIAIGGLVASSAYWLKYLFSIIESKPKELIDFLQLEADHNITVKQAQLEQSRSRLFAVKEKELIERAKRDDEVADIADLETKNKLINQLDNLRQERDQLSFELQRSQQPKENLSTEAKSLLLSASEDGSGTIFRLRTIGNKALQAGHATYGANSTREYVKYDAALDQLISFGFVKENYDNNDAFELTDKGWKFVDALSNT